MIDTPTLPEDAVEVHGLRPYPEYKPSGVEWLGDIPSHWGMSALRYLGSKFGSGLTPRGGATTYVSNGVLFLRSQNIHFDGLRLDDVAHISMQVDEEMSNSRVRVGDVLLNITGASIGRCCVVPDGIARANVNQHVCIVRPKLAKADPRFINYHLRSAPVQHLIQEVSLGAAREGLTQDDLKAFPVPLPSLKEQRGIADFLDAMDERITRFIDARRRMIALLEEQKQTIINQAVTKGLDPDVPMKPSGIDWLGEIPANWNVRRLKSLYHEVDERSSTGEEEQLSVSHLTGVTPRSQKTVTMFEAESYEGHKLCKSDDLVVNTMWAWMGALGVSRLQGLVSPSYATYRQRDPDEIESEYFHTLLRARPYVDEYNRRSTGIHTSRLRLYPDQFLNIVVPVPPKQEQESIAQHLVNLHEQTDRTERKYRQEIDLLQEYRTRLISDVVTGKLDVHSIMKGD